MRRLLLIFAVSAILFTACKKPDYDKVFSDPGLYSRTVFEFNTVVMGNNFSPPVASRNYAYASIAGYEVIVAGYPQKYQSLVGQLNGFKKVAKPIGNEPIDYDYAALFAFCKVGEAVTFPEGSLKYYTDSLHQMAAAHGMSSEMLDSSESYAKRVAKSVMAWSKGDHYLQTRSASKFAVRDSPGRWVLTPPGYFEA